MQVKQPKYSVIAVLPYNNYWSIKDTKVSEFIKY